MVEQDAERRGLQPQEEEGQTSLKLGQLKAAKTFEMELCLCAKATTHKHMYNLDFGRNGTCREVKSWEPAFFSDSVSCVGNMGDDPIATWKSQFKWFLEQEPLQGYEPNRSYADGVL